MRKIIKNPDLELIMKERRSEAFYGLGIALTATGFAFLGISTKTSGFLFPGTFFILVGIIILLNHLKIKSKS